MSSMSIFDDRLIPASAPNATPPNLADNTYRVNAAVALANAFTWVRDYANGQPGKRLGVFNILCHGLYQWEENNQLQMSTVVGGFGLQLGRENLTLNTLPTIVPLVRGKFTNVIIYACGAASAQSNSPVNGRTFCRELAGQLDCVVYAADRMQVYSFNPGTTNPLDFGDWEGNITRFTPDGNSAPVGRFDAKTLT